MTDQHPITPPPELVRKWIDEATSQTYAERWIFIVEQASQWGYDQRGAVNEAKLQKARDEELEACCEWLGTQWLGARTEGFPAELRAARRPKPPSLKKQALEALDEAIFMADDDPPEGICSDQADTIRRALEALPDD